MALFFWGVGLVIAGVYVRGEFGTAEALYRHAGNLLLLLGIGTLAYAGICLGLKMRYTAPPRRPGDWDLWS